MNFVSDCVCQLSRALPHSIIGNSNLILLICICPSSVFLNYLTRIVTPYHTVRRSDYVNRQVQLSDFLKLLGYERSERIKDICKILHRFLIKQSLIRKVIEHLLNCKVLSECIHREQDVITSHICSHGVWPVKHLHLHEDKLFAVSNIETVTSLYHIEVPSLLSVLTLKALYTCRSAV